MWYVLYLETYFALSLCWLVLCPPSINCVWNKQSKLSKPIKQSTCKASACVNGASLRYITSAHTPRSYYKHNYISKGRVVDTFLSRFHYFFFFVIKMPSSRQRASANPVSTVSLNEKILKECNDLYTEKEKGKNAWSSLRVVWRGFC